MGNRKSSISMNPEVGLTRKCSNASHSGYKLPKRIILVRHGESLGNEDEKAYERVPDWKIPLTEKGKQQSRVAASKIKELIGESKFIPMA